MHGHVVQEVGVNGIVSGYSILTMQFRGWDVVVLEAGAQESNTKAMLKLSRGLKKQST